MEISLISYRGLAITLVVTHQRVMPVIITDNHFDGNTRGESRVLRATRTCARGAARGMEKRDIVSLSRRDSKLSNANVYRIHVYLSPRRAPAHLDTREKKEENSYST